MTTLVLVVVGGFLCWVLISFGLARYFETAQDMEAGAALRRASGLPILLPALRDFGVKTALGTARWVRARWEARRRRKEAARAERLRREQEARTVVARSVRCGSVLPKGYEVRMSDSSRANVVDQWVKRHCRGIVYAQFGNVCTACGSDRTLDLDHAWWPKFHGGNFAMRHETGVLANVLLLCGACNASKSAAPLVDVFPVEVLEEMAADLEELTERFRADPELREQLYR